MEGHPSEGSGHAVDEVLEAAGAGIAWIIAEAEKATGVGVGDVLDVPDRPGPAGGLPICANVVATADAIGSRGRRRKACVRRVYLLADFDGRHSVNWSGNVMAPDGGWLDLDVLIARVEPPAKGVLKMTA